MSMLATALTFPFTGTNRRIAPHATDIDDACRRFARTDSPEALRKVAASLLDDEEWTRAQMANVSRPSSRALRSMAREGIVLPMPFDDDVDSEMILLARTTYSWMIRGILFAMENRQRHLLISSYTDTAIPREVRRAYYDRDIAGVCFHVTVQADSEDICVDINTVTRLYRAWTADVRPWLSLVEYFAHLGIPESLRSDIDWEHVFEEHVRLLDAKRSLQAKVEEAGPRPVLVLDDDE